MANTKANVPFGDEKPQLVHFEKDESHYEYCRMQMHDIEKVHRRTCLCNAIVCVLVCFLAIFKFYVAGFDVFSASLATADRGGSLPAGAMLSAGIFEILVALVVMVCGYLAWANFRMLNWFLGIWYCIVTLIAVFRLDYISALIGAVGLVFYIFSIREVMHENVLSEMPGYPNFQEKFDISKSDIVIQTLLAHQGERRTKSTLFTTDYSLRRKKKKSSEFTYEGADSDPTQALADELQKHIDDARDARQARTAIATLDAVSAAQKREKEAAEEANDAVKQAAAETAPAEEAPAAGSAPDAAQAADDNAAAIIAEAEAKAKAILAEALAKAEAMRTEQPAVTLQKEQSAPQNGGNRKKKKK